MNTINIVYNLYWIRIMKNKTANFKGRYGLESLVEGSHLAIYANFIV